MYTTTGGLPSINPVPPNRDRFDPIDPVPRNTGSNEDVRLGVGVRHLDEQHFVKERHSQNPL